jgi:hypothetical protein
MLDFASWKKARFFLSDSRAWQEAMPGCKIGRVALFQNQPDLLLVY